MWGISWAVNLACEPLCGGGPIISCILSFSHGDDDDDNFSDKDKDKYDDDDGDDDDDDDIFKHTEMKRCLFNII